MFRKRRPHTAETGLRRWPAPPVWLVSRVGVALCLVLGLLGAGTPTTAAAEPAAGDPDGSPVAVERAVVDQLAERGAADFWVVFDDTADLSGAEPISDWAERGRYVYDQLTATAKASQGEFLAGLAAQGVDHKSFWVANAVLVRGGDGSTLDAARVQSGVAEIRATRTYVLPDPIDEVGPDAEVDAVEWGIANIRADQVWDSFDVRGGGIVVGNIDSGVQFDHPALVDQYRGNLGGGAFDHDYHWWDPSGVCPAAEPCDNNNHGTHTMGTMVGDDGAGNQIGVAPRARWIAAKGCESRTCSDAALLSSGQFMLAPTDLAGENPRPELRPHVVNNSWGQDNGPAVNPFYRPVVTAWTAAGIFGVFSNGNDGPGCDTTGSPADYLESWAVGAYDSANRIASFSSRGPGENAQIRPSISAPGVDVRSSVADGGYRLSSGTSMAAPHQSGAVALIWSAAPSLAGEIADTRQLLAHTAIDTDDASCGGTADHNNAYGQGRLDAFAAVEQAPRGPAGTLAGAMTDRDSGAGVGGATITATGDDTFTTTSNPDGSYTLRLPVGTYHVTVEAHGYLGQSLPEVEIVEDRTTTRDFPLEPVPVMAVDPAELTSWQRPGETASQTLTIGNDGAADLDWTVADDGAACGTSGTPEWATVDPSAGTVAADGAQRVAVVFDSTGLPEGERAGEFCLAGNDPKRPLLAIDLTLRVDAQLPETWVQRDKLTPADRTETIDGFGLPVDVDGDTAVTLACTAPGGSSAYVYTRSGGPWRESAKLTPGESGCHAAFFPGSVAVDGDTIVVGLPLGADEGGGAAVIGRITVFARSGDEWIEQAEFAGLGYGFEVAIDGDTLVTSSAPDDGDFACPCPPHVYHRDGGEWTLQGELAFPDGAQLSSFGGTDLHGDTILVGGVEFADTPEGAWRAAIFSRTGGKWSFEAELAPSDGADGLNFADDDVSLDGDTAVVTAMRGDAPQNAAYVFTRDAGGWHEQQKLTSTVDDRNWRTVAIDGGRIMVGADGAGVHVWDQVGQVWRHSDTLVPGVGTPLPGDEPEEARFGRFGRSVAFDGGTAIISATPNAIHLPPLFPASNGPVYIFDTGEPAPTAGVKPAAADFGQVTVDEVSASHAMILENNGSAELRVGTLSLVGDHPGDFLLTDDECSGQTIRSGGSCTYEVRFVPRSRSLGPRSAQVELPSNASTAPDAVALTGEGLPAPPAIDVSPDGLVAVAPEGTRATEPLLISNQGSVDLAWSSFPDPASNESLTLRPADRTTAVPTLPIDLSLADLAQITPATSTEFIGETTSPPPSSEVAAPGTVTMSHSQTLEVQASNTARCGPADGTSGENRFLRTFTLPDFSLFSDVDVSQVTFGVESVDVPVDVTVNLYLLRGDFTYANLDRLATATVSLQPQAQTTVTVPISAVVPADSTLVMELAAPDLSGLGNFSAGSNSEGESAPSYLSTTECGAPEPIPYSRIGFPDTHLVMAVSGTVDCGATWLGVEPDGGTVAGGDTQLAEVTLDTTGLAVGTHTTDLCLASNDPRRQLTTVPVTLDVTEREPVTFDSLRDRVAVFQDSGAVTSTGAKRLMAVADRAEEQHDRDALDKAIKALLGFQKLSGDPKLVPGQDARETLTADAERLIEELQEHINDPGATAPVGRQQVSI